jgi:pimeloyl-[acyl-carrier protein] methyl ester esterase
VRPRLLFVHGWAMDGALWDGVRDALGEDAAGAAVTDAGFYGRPVPVPAIDGPVLGVGQSLGALELLAQPPAGLRGVVALDGFARFGWAEDFPQGTPARVLARMRKRLADGALAEFLARAGGQAPAGTPDNDRLADGLERLQALDGRASRLPVWRLHAAGDLIAPLALADASFEGLNVVERRVRSSSDHISPWHDPQGCAGLIRAAMGALS